MIVCTSPLRVSFTGGGTDLQYFFNENVGHVVSTSINKYVYVCLNKKFDNKLRVSYSITENVNSSKQLKHKLIKNILEHYNIKNGVEIVSIADVPGNGTGLGSSSAFACSLIQSINYYLKKKIINKQELAKISYNIEKGKDSLNSGKQDHYASACGGLNHLTFKKNGEVNVEKINLNQSFKNELENNLFLVFTGMPHNSIKNLKEQARSSNDMKINSLIELSQLSKVLAKDLKNSNQENFGDILNRSWEIKKRLNENISNYKINQIYKDVIGWGASGGKLLGSGGGGFLLFYAKKNKKNYIIKKIGKKNILDFEFETKGTNLYGQK